ncbi:MULTISPECIES: GH32 C-terminal domain-containing protein [unclassified Curtobacterium]|uniref:GH32 C-terminal domain-containing protein n=1 Tax=unclassified Curtobacterium TaxID=257496 RepID=UPI001FB305FF|nr:MULTISPECIES: GH32 C-terminal domain-containing protein [unclassified Curtobacterium]
MATVHHTHLQLDTPPEGGLRATLRFDPPQDENTRIALLALIRYTQVGYDISTGTVFIDRTHSWNVDFSSVFASRSEAPLQLARGGLDLRILVDASSIEVFGADGQVVLTDQIFPDSTSTGVSAFATGGTARVDDLRA